MSLHYVVLLLGSNLGNTKSNLKPSDCKIENCLGNIKNIRNDRNSTSRV